MAARLNLILSVGENSLEQVLGPGKIRFEELLPEPLCGPPVQYEIVLWGLFTVKMNDFWWLRLTGQWVCSLKPRTHSADWPTGRLATADCNSWPTECTKKSLTCNILAVGLLLENTLWIQPICNRIGFFYC